MKQILASNIDDNWPLIEVDYHKPVELYIDSFNKYAKSDSFKILWVKEAEAISGFKSLAMAYAGHFDAILTFDEEILSKCSNSHMMLFGTSWIHGYNHVDKKFQISHLTGHKVQTIGHKIRQEIHYRQKDIYPPIDFYISKYGGVNNFNNNKVLGEGKEDLFNSQFHICIENSKQKNYFTEKVVDCFITKTIPIYFGCPNIGDFFDVRGMFIVEDTHDILAACNSINENTYKEKLEFVEKNYELSKPFETITDRLKTLIDKILQEN